ncbi:MAG: hypothetical protein LBB50_03460, partial [Oscillospiraceae bacterium]|nr:hypothetical protein [Oscillospiraceae bacterium]
MNQFDNPNQGESRTYRVQARAAEGNAVYPNYPGKNCESDACCGTGCECPTGPTGAEISAQPLNLAIHKAFPTHQLS